MTLPGLDPARLWLGDWWKEEDLPPEWGRLLPGGPLNVEVGFGGGEFLLGMAARFPQRRFVGLERYAEGYRRCLKGAASEGLQNVLLMLGDAYVLLNICFGEASLESVTVNFPDPWPKARHARRRLFTEEFFGIAARKLADGGRLFLATDEEGYAGQAAEHAARVRELASAHPDRPWLTRSPYPLRTRYEAKWIEEGRPLHYLVYEKRSLPAEARGARG